MWHFEHFDESLLAELSQGILLCEVFSYSWIPQVNGSRLDRANSLTRVVSVMFFLNKKFKTVRIL